MTMKLLEFSARNWSTKSKRPWSGKPTGKSTYHRAFTCKKDVTHGAGPTASGFRGLSTSASSTPVAASNIVWPKGYTASGPRTSGVHAFHGSFTRFEDI